MNKLLAFAVLLATLAPRCFAQPPAAPPVVAPEQPQQGAGPTPEAVLHTAVRLLNNPAGKPDLTTPENTVRLFVMAIGDGDLQTARTCIKAAPPMEKLALTQKMLEPLRDHDWVINDLHAYVVGTEAQVMWRNKPIFDPGSETCERLFLSREAVGWQIVPFLPYSPALLGAYGFPKTRPADVMLDIASLIASPEVVEKRAAEEEKHRCQNNLKQLALGVAQYIQDWDQNYPDAAKWQEQIMPYVRSADLFICPQDITPNVKNSYAFNPKLTKLNQGKVEESAQTVMLYDAKNGEMEFRHKLGNGEDAANVAFADGHVKLIGREAAKNLRWNP